jgi:hypothetical protein
VQLPRPSVRRDAHAECLKRQPLPFKIEGFEVFYNPGAVDCQRVQLFHYYLLLDKALIKISETSAQLCLLLLGLRDLAPEQLPWKRLVIGLAKMAQEALLLFFELGKCPLDCLAIRK